MWEYSTHGGKGGQHANKTATAVTVRHLPSRAVGHAADSKSQWQNRQNAWKRMADSKEFRRWLQMEVGISLVTEAAIMASVERQLRPELLRVEKRVDGKWVPFEV